MKRTYRSWVEAGARGFWMGACLTIVSTEIVAPDTILPGYVARQTASDPATDGPAGQFGLLNTGALGEEWLGRSRGGGGLGLADVGDRR